MTIFVNEQFEIILSYQMSYNSTSLLRKNRIIIIYLKNGRKFIKYARNLNLKIDFTNFKKMTIFVNEQFESILSYQMSYNSTSLLRKNRIIIIYLKNGRKFIKYARNLNLKIDFTNLKKITIFVNEQFESILSYHMSYYSTSLLSKNRIIIIYLKNGRKFIKYASNLKLKIDFTNFKKMTIF